LDDHGHYVLVMLVFIVIVVGMIRLVDSRAKNVFSEAASSIGG
jgi:hypothetical protein